MKKITIYDIASETGVSAATVSRAISGNGYVAGEKKERIMELVDKYNFVPNTFAKNLQAGYTKTIGFIVPNVVNQYFAYVYYEFEKIASEQGYMTILLNSQGEHEIESKILNNFLLQNVDGVVMMGGRVDVIDVSKEDIIEIQEYSKKVPVVLCGRATGRFMSNGVYTNDDRGVEMLLAHLKDRGHRDIFFIGGNDKFYPSYDKKVSAYKYGEKMGLNVRVDRLSEETFNYKAGVDSMKVLLEREELPDAICGINDGAAVGAMNAAIQAGIKVPGAIAFAGFDYTDACRNNLVELTSVSPRYEYFAKRVFRRLEQLIRNEGEGGHTLELFKPELVVRESTLYKRQACQEGIMLK